MSLTLYFSKVHFCEVYLVSGCCSLASFWSGTTNTHFWQNCRSVKTTSCRLPRVLQELFSSQSVEDGPWRYLSRYYLAPFSMMPSMIREVHPCSIRRTALRSPQLDQERCCRGGASPSAGRCWTPAAGVLARSPDLDVNVKHHNLEMSKKQLECSKVDGW